MMLYICVKFHQNIWNGFQLPQRTRIHSRNGYFQNLLCSKGRNSKSRLTRVTVFSSARCVMVLYICEKFHQNIRNGFQLTKRTRVHCRNDYVQCSESNNSKSWQTKVTVYVVCTSSHSALHLCEV